MTQPTPSDAMKQALEPFIRAARYFEYYIPEMMPSLTFPVSGSYTGALDGFPQFSLTADNFKALQAALATQDAEEIARKKRPLQNADVVGWRCEFLDGATWRPVVCLVNPNLFTQEDPAIRNVRPLTYADTTDGSPDDVQLLPQPPKEQG